MNEKPHMTATDSTFFKVFGRRVSTLRKARGFTQSELGELLGLDQTAIASYEVGRRRIPLSLLAPLAQALRISVAELVEEETPGGKRGPTPKLQRQIEQVGQLTKSKQKFVSEMLDTVLQSAE